MCTRIKYTADHGRGLIWSIFCMYLRASPCVTTRSHPLDHKVQAGSELLGHFSRKINLNTSVIER
jgi:hypothetical protein